jgi:hypothetical protein
VEVCEVSVICGVHAHWSYPDTILECHVADLEGSEECGWILRESGSCRWVLDGREVGSVGCGLVSGCRYKAHCNGRYMYICINSRAKDQKFIKGITVTKGVRRWRTEGREIKDLGILPRGADQFVSVKGGEELRDVGLRGSILAKAPEERQQNMNPLIKFSTRAVSP